MKKKSLVSLNKNSKSIEGGVGEGQNIYSDDQSGFPDTLQSVIQMKWRFDNKIL